VKLCVTGIAAVYVAFPACVAVIEQVPTANTITIVPAAAQMAGVVEAKLTASPELADAVRANAGRPKLTLPGWGNEIVCAMGATVKLCVTGVAAM
jgi:hypothetical protein